MRLFIRSLPLRTIIVRVVILNEDLVNTRVISPDILQINFLVLQILLLLLLPVTSVVAPLLASPTAVHDELLLLLIFDIRIILAHVHLVVTCTCLAVVVDCVRHTLLLLIVRVTLLYLGIVLEPLLGLRLLLTHIAFGPMVRQNALGHQTHFVLLIRIILSFAALNVPSRAR